MSGQCEHGQMTPGERWLDSIKDNPHWNGRVHEAAVEMFRQDAMVAIKRHNRRNERNFDAYGYKPRYVGPREWHELAVESREEYLDTAKAALL